MSKKNLTREQAFVAGHNRGTVYAPYPSGSRAPEDSRDVPRGRGREGASEDVRDVHETPKDAASFEAIISSTNFRTLTTKESLKGDVRRRQWVRVAQLSKVANRRNRENQNLKLVVVVLAEAGGNERSGLRGADGLARAGFGKNDVPEVGVWRAEGDANKAALPLLAQGSDMTLGRFGRHLIENTDVLPGDEGRIHKQEGSVGAHHVSGSLQINGFAFGEAATYFHWDLERQPNRAPTFRVSSSLHKRRLCNGTAGQVPKCCHEKPRKARKIKIWDGQYFYPVRAQSPVLEGGDRSPL